MKTPINGLNFHLLWYEKTPIDGYNKMHRGTERGAYGNTYYGMGDGVVKKLDGVVEAVTV